MGQQRKRHKQRHRQTATIVAVTPNPIILAPESAIMSSAPPPRPLEVVRVIPQTSAVVRSDVAVVRRELVRVIVVLGIVAAVLVGLLLTNQQTGWLNRIADLLYRWLRLG